MKKKLTAKLAATLLLCSVLQVNAQHAVGLYAGNHNAPYSAFQNPANAMPDMNRLYLNFWGANLGFTNNFITYNAPFGMVQWANGKYPDAYKSPAGKLYFDQDWLQWGKASNEKLYYLSEVYGPSLFLKATDRIGFGFGIRSVSGISMTGVNADLGKLLRFGLDSNGQALSGANALTLGKKYSNGAFSINTDNYQEWFFSLAGVTRNDGPNFVKWGATAKFLAGVGSMHLGANSLDYTIQNNRQVDISNTTMRYMHTTDASIADGLSHPLGLNFNQINGAGAGMDLGFLYEYRPNKKQLPACNWNTKTQYDWKFGASVTDLGIIGYNGSTRKLDATKTKTWNINKDAINTWQYYQGMDRFANVDQYFFDDSSMSSGSGKGYALTTPATFNAQLDMNMGSNFFFGINWSQSLKGQNSLGLRKASYLSMVPRWEGEHLELGMPITLSRDYTALNVGLYGRLGPFILGTDNLAGLTKFVTNSSYKAANIYFAVRLQIKTCGRYHQDDRDSVLPRDTIYKNDTTTFWKRDTMRYTKRDTIIKTKVVHDTVVRYANTEIGIGDPGIKQREDDLSKREAAVKQKEADLKTREDEIRRKENTNMSTTGDCSRRIAELEDQLRKEKDLYYKLNLQYQDCNDEKTRQAAKIADLEQQLVALRKLNNDLGVENTGLRTQIDNLKAEIARLRMNNTPCDKQVKSLDSLLAIEQAKNTDLNKELSKQKATVSSQNADLEAGKKRITELETQLAVLKVSNGNGNDKACQDKINALQAELAAERAKTANLTKQVATVGTQKDSLAKENSTIKAKVTQNDSNLSNVKKQLDELRKQYGYELAENQRLRDQLKKCGTSSEAEALRVQLDAQKKKCDDLSTQIATLQSQKDALEKDNSALKAKVTQLQGDVSILKAKLDEQTQKVADLQEQLKNCGNADELSKAKATISDLQKKNDDLQKQLTDLSTAKAKLEGDLSDAKAKIADLQDQLSKCQNNNDCDEVKAELADYKNKYNAVKEEYDALLAERNKLKSDLDSCKAQLQNCSGNASGIDDLKAEISKLKITITELNGQLDSKQKSLDDLQDAYNKVTGENASLKKQIADLQAQIKSLNDKVADLQAKLKACQDAAGGPGNN